jgi:hypothetical protein
VSDSRGYNDCWPAKADYSAGFDFFFKSLVHYGNCSTFWGFCTPTDSQKRLPAKGFKAGWIWPRGMKQVSRELRRSMPWHFRVAGVKGYSTPTHRILRATYRQTFHRSFVFSLLPAECFLISCTFPTSFQLVSSELRLSHECRIELADA